MLTLLMLSSSILFAQKTKKVDKLIASENYPEVIHSLKNTKGNESELLLKLADSYYQVKNYECAEETYAKYFQYAKQPETEAYFNYGQTLLTNKLYDSAKVQFQKYIQKVPSDYRAQRCLKACNKLTTWSELPVKYEVRNMKELNSSYSDFCAVDYKDGVVFVSERGEDIVGGSKYVRTANSYVSIQYAKYKKQKNDTARPTFKPSKLFSTKIAGDYHTGPVSFSRDYSEIYYTQVKSMKGKRTGTITPKIFRAKQVAGNWRKGADFTYNGDDDSFSTAHACLSPDGSRLYFVSNRKGTKGGMDIFYCERRDDRFGEPINLGSVINTPGNESFPFITENNVLYFSTDARGGYGGMDIFYSILQDDDKWTDPVNLKAPINSFADDFGIYFKKGEEGGYLSSNRSGGKGSDDIYEFTVRKNIVDVRGKLVADTDSSQNLEGVKMAMIDDKGKIIQTTETTTGGDFVFENVYGSSYKIIRIDPSQEKLAMQKSLSILFGGNKKYDASKKDKDGNFIFELLPTDQTELSRVQEEDATLVVRKKFIGSLASGKNNDLPLSGVRISLSTTKRAMVQSRITDEHGVFEFDNIRALDEYHVSIDNENSLVKQENTIAVKDSRGKVIVSVKRNDEERFEFDFLPTDKTYITMVDEEDAQLRINIKGTLVCSSKDGKKDKITGAKVFLLNDKGETVRVATTDGEGNFRFTHLPPELNYKMSTNESDPLLRQCAKVEILDKQGNVVFESEKGKAPRFNFPFLPYDKSTMALTEEENAALLIRKKFMGSIMSGNNNNTPLPGLKISLKNAARSIVQSRMTDDRGVFSFDNIRAIEDYNVTIEGDEALLKPEKSIIIKDSKGNIVLNIERNRDNKFEFQLLPTDKTVMTLVEEEDVQLRINMKGKLVCGEKKDKIIGAKVFLLNEKEEIVQVAKTNIEGDFKFTHIPADMTYKITTEESDPALRYCKTVKILDKNGTVIFVSEKGKAGRFHFALLPHEKSTLAMVEEEEGILRVNYKGKLKSDAGEVIPGASLYLKEKESVERIKTKTDKEGNFEFSQLPTDKTYVVQVDENDPALVKYNKISIYDSEGKESYTGDKGSFNYEFLPTDKTNIELVKEEEAPPLKMVYRGKLKNEDNVNITDAKVILRNSKSGDRYTTTTDKNGKFEFGQLPTDQSYILEIDEKDPALAMHKRIKVFTESDKEVYAANKENFKLEILPTDKTFLVEAKEEETELRIIKKKKKDTTLVAALPAETKFVYFNVDAESLDGVSLESINKLTKQLAIKPYTRIEIITHTDNRASQQYNLELSKRRMEYLLNKLVANGIDATKIKGEYYGETKPVYNCLPCTQEQHRQNRRTEIKISYQ